MAAITSGTETKKLVKIVILGESDDIALIALRDLLGCLSNESMIKLVGSYLSGGKSERYFKDNVTNIVDFLYRKLNDVLD